MSIEKQIKDEKENTCCKCGAYGGSMYARHGLHYDSSKNLLIKTCCDCGYQWYIKSKDAKDET